MKPKKWIIVFLYILVFALIGSNCTKNQTTTPADSQQQETKNTGNIKIVAMNIPNEQIIAFKFVFHTGSMYDPQGKNGLAYLTAQMLAKAGTQNNNYQSWKNYSLLPAPIKSASIVSIQPFMANPIKITYNYFIACLKRHLYSRDFLMTIFKDSA